MFFPAAEDKIRSEIEPLGLYLAQGGTRSAMEEFDMKRSEYMFKDYVSHFILRVVFCKVGLL